MTPAGPREASRVSNWDGELINRAYQVQQVPTGRKKSQTVKTRTIRAAVRMVLLVRARMPTRNSRVGRAEGVLGSYMGSKRNGCLQSSHRVEPDWESQLTRQSSWVNLMEPEQRHGWRRGRSGSSSPRQMRHSCSGSGSAMPAYRQAVAQTLHEVGDRVNEREGSD